MTEDDTTETLVIVDAPHFNAAVILMRGSVVRAAPILKWSLGWDAERLSAYFKRKGWKATQRRCPPAGINLEPGGPISEE